MFVLDAESEVNQINSKIKDLQGSQGESQIIEGEPVMMNRAPSPDVSVVMLE